MYSPKIERFTPCLYRLSKAVDKPMTKVADDLMSYALGRLDTIYENLSEEDIVKITESSYDKNKKNT